MEVKANKMPEICLFYGIRIAMNYNEHNPPHFHVQYAEYNAQVLIKEGVIYKGYLPSRQLKLVLAWCEIHEDELMQNWELSKSGKAVCHINPLV